MTKALPDYDEIAAGGAGNRGNRLSIRRVRIDLKLRPLQGRGRLCPLLPAKTHGQTKKQRKPNLHLAFSKPFYAFKGDSNYQVYSQVQKRGGRPTTLEAWSRGRAEGMLDLINENFKKIVGRATFGLNGADIVNENRMKIVVRATFGFDGADIVNENRMKIVLRPMLDD